MTTGSPGHSWQASTARLLGPAAWLVLAAGVAATFVVPAPENGGVSESVTVVTIGTFFVVLVVRLVLVSIAWPGRRVSLLSLALGVLLWAAGAAVLNSSGQPSGIQFPAPGEWFFLAAYTGFASYLILDSTGRNQRSLSASLEAVVACGGAACLAGALMVTPVASQFGRQGVPLLVALLYPLLDMVLVALVLGQLVLRQRAASWTAAATLGGLAFFAIADTSLVVNLSRETYDYGLTLDVCWLLGFLLLVGAACRPQSEPGDQPAPRRFVAASVVGAELVALVVLTFQPSGQARAYVVIPAVVTLLAAGARMVQALRAARGAAEAYRLSLTDDLTGLPNRRAAKSRVQHGLAKGEPLGVMLLDLDGFKEINDSLGHAAGDTMLKIVANRLRKALPPRVLICRLGGDEFALMIPDGDPVKLLESAHEVRDLVRKPARIDGLELTITGSIGLAVSAEEDHDFGDLLRRADIAMYQAKTNRSGALLYDSARDDFSRQRLTLAEELRRGIPAGELVLWYQPQVEAVSQRVYAVEALVRWQHPREGLLPPGAFLPVARRAGLMGALSEWVIETMTADLARWKLFGLQVHGAVNLAPPELLGGSVLTRLFEHLDSTGLLPGSVIVEVTEDSFLAEPERAREVLLGIRDRGIQVSIDDYGTGYSSLSYLRDLPVQELKIDRSFVAAICTDPRSKMIVSTTNQMAHGLGLRTVAEGVEDQETMNALIHMGVDIVQGYLVARPMPSDAIVDWVTQWDDSNALVSS
jgi:diguanylate cyclase (GGDEF)-like protein